MALRSACVSIIDPVTLAMKPVASFADDPDYMQSVEVSADPDSPLSRGATGAAIRERRPAWRQDLANDSEWQPWRERGKRSGWAAAAALPLLRGPTVIGAFALYSGEKDAFDPALRQLLIGMVADIGFALENFEREAQRQRISENLEFRNALLQTQLETSLDAILVVGEKGEVVSYNQQFVKLWICGEWNKLSGWARRGRFDRRGFEKKAQKGFPMVTTSKGAPPPLFTTTDT